MMLFLLVVVVNGEPIADRFFYRDITRCNTFARYIESGKVDLVKDRRVQKQENITAYCIPKRMPKNTKTWD
jgi:hypothetical protein